MDLISPFMKHPGDSPVFKHSVEIPWPQMAGQDMDEYINDLEANGLKVHIFSTSAFCRFWFQHKEDAVAFTLKYKCV
jgi:hypothetical protein